MFLEEKIEAIKNKLSQNDLTIRYTNYKSVVTKVESKFLKRTNPNFYFNGWIERFQDFEKSNFEEI